MKFPPLLGLDPPPTTEQKDLLRGFSFLQPLNFYHQKILSGFFFCSTGCNQIIGKTQFPAGSYKIEKNFHDSCFKKIILPWKLLYSKLTIFLIHCEISCFLKSHYYLEFGSTQSFPKLLQNFPGEKHQKAIYHFREG